MKLLRMSLVIAVALTFGCSFTQKIKSGTEAYEVRQYSVAAILLEEEYHASQRLEEKAVRAFMIGQCYAYMRQPENAAPWYKRAFDDKYGTQALEQYADMLRQSERYNEAIEAYEELMATGTDVQRYRGLISLCNQAMQWKAGADMSPYEIREVEFNSQGSDYAPFILGSDLLLFTSDRENSSGNTYYNWTGRDFSDLYMVNLVTGIVQPFDHVLNTGDNEGTVTMTSDRKEMYFTRCTREGDEYDSYCKIMVCYLRGASWSSPETLPFLKEGINYGHPVITGKDSILIFSANDPEGSGGYDLYYSLRTANGWGIPVSMGERINTLGNERFPSMHKDTLYFSSDQHPGLGGYDIFKTYLNASGEWVPPLNLKPPINSGWDDFGFIVDTLNRKDPNVLLQGYFSTSRNAASGDDIYLFRKVYREPPEVVVDENDDKDIDYEVYLAVKTYEAVFNKEGDPNSGRKGKRPLPRTAYSIEEGATARREVTDETGLMVLRLDWDKTYLLQPRRKGYFTPPAQVFSTRNLERDPDDPVATYNMEFILDPIFEDTEIVLENIYYDYDEWYIRDDAKPSLDSLAHILRDNPTLRIQLSSHTDCRGEVDYNQELSQKRAQSAVDYLVSAGIAIERLVAVGYGENRLEVNCACDNCSEEEHQQNRRTTFKIIGDQ